MVSPYKYSRDYPLHNIRRNTEHSQADVVPACQLTLKNLQLDYVDLYLVSVCVCVSVFTHNYNFLRFTGLKHYQEGLHLQN